jgi:hypothetical protein
VKFVGKVAELLEQKDISDSIEAIEAAIEYILTNIPDRIMDKRNLLADIAESKLDIFENETNYYSSFYEKKQGEEGKRARKALEIIRNKEATVEQLEAAADKVENEYWDMQLHWSAKVVYYTAYWAAAIEKRENKDIAYWSKWESIDAFVRGDFDYDLKELKQMILKYFGND